MDSMTFDLRRNYDNDFDSMMNDVNDVMKVLLRNYHIFTFEYEDCGIYVLKYAHNDKHEPYLGEDQPYWLTCKEIEDLENIVRADDNIGSDDFE